MNNTITVSEKLRRSLVEWHEFKFPPIISRNIERNGKKIRVRPMWYFVLDTSALRRWEEYQPRPYPHGFQNFRRLRTRHACSENHQKNPLKNGGSGREDFVIPRMRYVVKRSDEPPVENALHVTVRSLLPFRPLRHSGIVRPVPPGIVRQSVPVSG